MKNLFVSFTLFTSLIVFGVFVFEKTAEAQIDYLPALLDLPAPPPANPLMPFDGERSEEFFDKKNPPADAAPIGDLLDYWQAQSGGYKELGYNVKPSARSLDRILAEIEKDPKKLPDFINVLPEKPEIADFVKRLYDQRDTAESEYDYRWAQVKKWLTYRSPYFSEELLRSAQTVGDTSVGYVSNQEELLALARVDWAKAKPILDRLYNDPSQPVSQTLARWAFYRRALDTDAIGDAERYRDELKRDVENRSASDGQRDLAFDALVKEKDFSGRDEWYFSLLEDETLADLRVGGQSYTGLTTILIYSPPEKYADKMIELVKSANPAVRNAAIRNLGTLLDDKNVEAVRALLPWLENPKWAREFSGERSKLINALQNIRLPESVPGLIAVLNEKQTRGMISNSSTSESSIGQGANDLRLWTKTRAALAAVDELRDSTINVDVDDGVVTLKGTVSTGSQINAAIQAANSIEGVGKVENLLKTDSDMANVAVAANQMVTMTNMMNSTGGYSDPAELYPYRIQAIAALANQKDARAVPALRQALNEVETYQQPNVVNAIYLSNGFSIGEQIEALESVALDVHAQIEAQTAVRQSMLDENQIADDEESESEVDEPSTIGIAHGDIAVMTNSAISGDSRRANDPPTVAAIRKMLGEQLAAQIEPGAELLSALVRRVSYLDAKNPPLAAALCRIILNWQGDGVNLLLLEDLKNNKAGVDSIVRLLSVRKTLREKNPNDVYALRSGGDRKAFGISACLLENPGDYDAILSSGSDEAKIALLACARLIRAELPVQTIARHLDSPNKLLALAAERYLESEDSPAARMIILSRYPNEARILGAKAYFAGDGRVLYSSFLDELFRSVHNTPLFHDYYIFDGAQQNSGDIEKKLQKEVRDSADLLGVYAYDGNFVRIYKDKIVYSFAENDSRFRERALSANEFNYLKDHLFRSRVDELAPFLSYCAEECSEKELLMLGRQGGRRVYLKSYETPEFFSGLDKIFAEMRKPPARLRYELEKSVAGLEILFADENLKAAAVWKNGDDLRVLIGDSQRREQVESELENEFSQIEYGENADYGQIERRMRERRAAREFEYLSWRRIDKNSVGNSTASPPGIDLPPPLDAFPVRPSTERWKTRAANAEYRADETGLYRIAGGRMTKLREGYYYKPVVSADGRWLVAAKPEFVRVDLAANCEYAVEFGESPFFEALAAFPSGGKFLIRRKYYYDHHEDDSPDPADDELYILDAQTGAVAKPKKDEFRPLARQTFRPLQPTEIAGEFWAAIYDRKRKATDIGRYSVKTFSFKLVMRIPDISLTSMDVWVDEKEAKVYFVSEGHLLALPLPKQ